MCPQASFPPASLDLLPLPRVTGSQGCPFSDSIIVLVSPVGEEGHCYKVGAAQILPGSPMFSLPHLLLREMRSH